MYKCLECGKVFDDDEMRKEREYVGEFWGTDAYQDYYCCPHCKSDEIYEAHQCERCGEWFTDEEEFNQGYCEKCLNEIKQEYNTVDKVYDLCDRQDIKDKVEINSALLNLLSSVSIEGILLDYAKNMEKNGFIDAYDKCQDLLYDIEDDVIYDYDKEMK